MLILAIFTVLHALVHMLYVGQLFNWFKLPGGRYGDESWLLGDQLQQKPLRGWFIATMILCMVGFLLSAIGILGEQSWWHGMLIASAGVSSLLFVAGWNGKLKHLEQHGIIGVIINLILILLAIVNG